MAVVWRPSEKRLASNKCVMTRSSGSVRVIVAISGLEGDSAFLLLGNELATRRYVYTCTYDAGQLQFKSENQSSLG